ncbi:LEF-6 [Buzura suppressaria nucleopolyhedrovirus]|uniref:LEF-6 n=1 Tax=Buzura suppressaria nuclear polyhedrosis virus TaxID=74320 RepID=W5VKX1_NPVBS|nr:LEF-6 [Buzura suppressaria nucleopolyhedrovirus]AHH82599.1 LEF-6 [Buzura suppressaria nucleopolyhedrovirus]QYF10592.1 late expression factor 6 [Buzura suppressaria nucleopolyhedrovirus]
MNKMAAYVFYYNGGNVNKRFTREFLLYVLDTNLVKHHINWNQSGRKRLMVTSRSMADRLLHINQQIYWPNGELFKCKLLDGGCHDERFYRRRQHYNHDYKSNVRKETTQTRNTEARGDEIYDWYTNGFVDIKLGESDNEENMGSLDQDIDKLRLNGV